MLVVYAAAMTFTALKRGVRFHRPVPGDGVQQDKGDQMIAFCPDMGGERKVRAP